MPWLQLQLGEHYEVIHTLPFLRYSQYYMIQSMLLLCLVDISLKSAYLPI